MHLKRFRRETVQEALRAAREELGAGALVLSTRVVAAPGARGWLGRRHVEVTAAVERPLVSGDRHVQSEAFDERWIGGTSDDRPDAPFGSGAVVSSVASRVRKREQRAVASLTAQLQATGLDPVLAHDVATAHPTPHRRGATIHSLRKTLAGQLATLAADDEGYAPVEVFVGPPGVGKTTTIAKIASQERARGGTRLGLVAADGFRVGAVEQLRLYADILGTPLTVARTPDELARAIEDARRPLLVDTAGRSPHDDVSREMLRVFAGRAGVRTHLVLAASTPADLIRRTLGRFGDARPSRLVITKLDEAESLAPIVGVLREQQIPISYLGTGQTVPEDLERATPPALAAWVAGDVCHGGAV
jgi:flagellar biosynthesis protein FlhF